MTVKLYVVQKDDTLAEIARKHGMTIDEFRKMNTGLSEESLTQGMKVKVAIGKQPLKRVIQANDRAEAPHVQAPQTQQVPSAPVDQQPTSQQQPTMEAPTPAPTPEQMPMTPNVTLGATAQQPSANTGLQGTEAAPTEYPNIFYPKHPMMQENWTTSGADAYPNSSGPHGQTGISPATQGTMWNAVSPASQGVSSPYYPNTGGMVSPETQGNALNPYYPTDDGGSLISPAMTPGSNAAGTMGSFVNPMMQGASVNPYYPMGSGGNVMSPAMQENNAKSYPQPTSMAGESTPQVAPMNPYHPTTQMGQMSPYYPPMTPWSGNKPQYPVSHGTIKLDQPYAGVSETMPKTLPWSNTQNASASTQSNPSMMKPSTGKLSPAGSGKVGGYSSPYMPAAKRPCTDCGGPTLYSPYAQMPVGSYYAGNQPPQAQPMPYSALSNPNAPIYQPEASKKRE
ncbi:LysM peptidoglycan-binding domain-containing protein [Sporolactobacillus kofuensis]|uniref:LysM peptidoglycan-binding domain-containing protein n=1 Tax=Sporolactobacillus kofuensis TaxID=269672 RepID=A0ABW1WDB6_9BACL|nr:LysM peptidoglycan-binding domain-containing protein [Sporolactobacillus kofuensis]MCO7175594.1 LysM peptidoglycan-binding domain-containing protein [Sporolactobacillus kofuensis]